MLERNENNRHFLAYKRTVVFNKFTITGLFDTLSFISQVRQEQLTISSVDGFHFSWKHSILDKNHLCVLMLMQYRALFKLQV